MQFIQDNKLVLEKLVLADLGEFGLLVYEVRVLVIFTDGAD